MNTTYIGGIQRFSTEDGPGIRTNIFFKGCPLSCKWCHNPELLDPGYGLLYKESDCIKCGRCAAACESGVLSVVKKEDSPAVTSNDDLKLVIDREKCIGCGACVIACPTLALFTKSKEYTMDELLTEMNKDKDYFEMSGGGITLSGGEVLMHAEHALAVGEMAKEAGFTVAVETSGFGKYEDLLALARMCDYMLFDVKHMDKEKHKEYIGADSDLILSNLEKLCLEEGLAEKITVRLPMLKDVNDSEENILAVKELMKKLGLKKADILPYHNLGVGKAKQAGFSQETYETPDDEVLERNRDILRGEGYKVCVMGHEE